MKAKYAHAEIKVQYEHPDAQIYTHIYIYYKRHHI
jgi:hypothetical protein